MENGNEMRISRMTNFKCQSTNEIQMPNVKFYYWDFPIRTMSGRVGVDSTFVISILTLRAVN